MTTSGRERALRLDLLAEPFAVVRLDPDASLPEWASTALPHFVARTPGELSVVCPEHAVPSGERARRGLRCLVVRGPLSFDEIGVLDALARPLAEAAVTLLAISTFETDYVFVPEERLGEAMRALAAAGHGVEVAGEAVDLAIEKVAGLPRGFEALAKASVREGHRFLERLRLEWEAGDNRFDRPGEALFSARFEGALAGLCGLNRDPHTSDPELGRLRRLYVHPRFRRRGVARRLVLEALSLARSHYTTVRVRTHDPAAAALYEALGFVAASTPEATHELPLAGGIRNPSTRRS